MIVDDAGDYLVESEPLAVCAVVFGFDAGAALPPVNDRGEGDLFDPLSVDGVSCVRSVANPGEGQRPEIKDGWARTSRLSRISITGPR
ncbi:hypothetical protein [Micromonospora pallida]|uniref:hypothetical protein n=1 Tax=Micromonospora pallida TaxID=145854 RepID=UPI00114D2A2B|nr:hypothetical protein [Micromonospora pallida]